LEYFYCIIFDTAPALGLCANILVRNNNDSEEREYMRYIVSIFITVAFLAVTNMCVSPEESGPELIATEFAGGNGTATNPWQIENAAQLAYLAQEVNRGNTYINNANAHFELIDNIILNETTNWENWHEVAPANSWTAIGFDATADDRAFLGIFNGNDFAVKGLYISNQLDNQGLFGFTNGATIKNLTVKYGFVRARNFAGGIVGHGEDTLIYNSTNGVNVFLYKTNHHSGFVGGVAGYVNTILNSVNHGSVTARGITDNSGGTDFTTPIFVGGIAGSVSNRVVNSLNRGDVNGYSTTSTADAGGIVGQLPLNATVINSINLGNVTADSLSTSGRAGGIVGSNNGDILNCYNAGIITSTSTTRWVGGIAGLHGNGLIANSYWLRNSDSNINVVSGAGSGARSDFAHFGNYGTFFTGTLQASNTSTLLLNDILSVRTSCVLEMLNAWVKNEHLNNRNLDLLFFMRTSNDANNSDFHQLRFVDYQEVRTIMSRINISFMNDQALGGEINSPTIGVSRAGSFITEINTTNSILFEVTVETGQFINQVKVNGEIIDIANDEHESTVITIGGFSYKAWWSQFENGIPSGFWIELSEITENVDVIASVSPMIYSITYRNLLTGADNSLNPDNFTMFDNITLLNLSGNVIGFIFSHWSLTQNGPSINGIDLGTTGDIEIWAVWSLATYQIFYYFQSSTGITLKDVNNPNPSNYNFDSESIILANPSIAGYDFVGWFLDSAHTQKITAVAIETGTTGNKTFFALFTPITYNVDYKFHSTSGRTLTGVENLNPDNFNIESTAITLVNPSITGYDFVGWFLDSSHLIKANTIAIESGSIGNRIFYALFTPIDFEINYVFQSTSGIILTNVINLNLTNFNIETNCIALLNPTLDDYDFIGWFFDASHLLPIKDLAINEGSTGNRTFYGLFSPKNFEITYLFHSVSSITLTGITNPNPKTFNVESEDIILVEPSLLGYDFIGWFLDSEHLIPLKGVAILEGSTGNKSFYALFIPQTFEIDYHFHSSSGIVLKGVINDNPLTFTIETNDIILLDPSLLGYDFIGWFLDASHQLVADEIAISEGSIGNRVFYALFSPTKFTINYHFISSTGLILTGITNENPNNYNVESADIILVEPSLAGYNFIGWFLDSENLMPVDGIAIYSGSLGNINFYGLFTPITFEISFNFHSTSGRILSGVKNLNPIEFNVETPTITLEKLSLPGYDFIGWFLNANHTIISETVSIGTVGNQTFYALFNPINYQINYIFNSLSGLTLNNVINSNPLIFTIESSDINLSNPSLAGYNFIGWFWDSEYMHKAEGVVIPEGSTGDKVFYALFIPINFDISFNFQSTRGRTLTGIVNTNPTEFNIESSNITLTILSLRGYNFIGWFTDSEHQNAVGAIAIETGSIGNQTFFALFEPISYTIIYDANRPINSSHNIRGAMPNSIHEFDGTTRISNNAFNLVGFTFLGWSTSEDQLFQGNTYAMELLSTISLDNYPIILRAQWSINIYEILFLAEDGVTILNTGNTLKEFGSVITSPESAPLIDGKVFVRWDGFHPGQTVSSNHQFRAIYMVETVEHFTVIFRTIYGRIISEYMDVAKGTAISTLLPTDPIIVGRAFIGWNGFTNINQTVTSDLIFTAIFADNVMRTVEFFYEDALGLVLLRSYRVPVGTPVATLFPLVPSISGKTFVGWAGYDSDMLVAEDIALTATYVSYTGQFVTIHFICHETNINYTRTVAVGTNIALVGLSIPQRAGYNFLGWEGLSEDNVTENLTLTATWQSTVSNGLPWRLIISVISGLWIAAAIILVVVFKLRAQRNPRKAV